MTLIHYTETVEALKNEKCGDADSVDDLKLSLLANFGKILLDSEHAAHFYDSFYVSESCKHASLCKNFSGM